MTSPRVHNFFDPGPSGRGPWIPTLNILFIKVHHSNVLKIQNQIKNIKNLSMGQDLGIVHDGALRFGAVILFGFF